MVITVAGGFNTLLIHPPLPMEVFAELVPPRIIGKEGRAHLAYPQYRDMYTGIQYKQEAELRPTVPPIQYSREVCAYLGKAGIEIELDEQIYGMSPESLLLLTTEAAVIEKVESSTEVI